MPEYTSILYSVILCKQSELQITVLDQKITKSCFLKPTCFLYGSKSPVLHCQREEKNKTCVNVFK